MKLEPPLDENQRALALSAEIIGGLVEARQRGAAWSLRDRLSAEIIGGLVEAASMVTTLA